MKHLLLCVHDAVESLRFENFAWSFGRLCQRIVLKCVLHVEQDYFSSITNQIIAFWRRRCRYRGGAVLKLSTSTVV